MSRIARILASGSTLLLALILSTGNAEGRYFDEFDDAQKEMKKLYDVIAAGQAGGKIDDAQVKAIIDGIKKKDLELEALMSVYKPTKSKGVGYNPAKKGPGDGIEKRITDLGNPDKKPIPRARLVAEKALLTRMALYNLAIYEVAKAYPPAKPKNGKGTKEWNKHNAELKEGTQELLKAIKANDPDGLKKAAVRINAGCTDCHTDFR